MALTKELSFDERVKKFFRKVYTLNAPWAHFERQGKNGTTDKFAIKTDLVHPKNSGPQNVVYMQENGSKPKIKIYKQASQVDVFEFVLKEIDKREQKGFVFIGAPRKTKSSAAAPGKSPSRMKLPTDLGRLRDKIVVVGAPIKAGGRRLDQEGTGILFDASTKVHGTPMLECVVDHFSDCESSDFKDLRNDQGDLLPDWIPFLMWMPDGLDNQDKQVEKQTTKASTRTMAYTSFGEYPQFQEMWFLHRDGRVTSIEIDGSFLPEKKSHLLVKDYKKLKLRMATVRDLKTSADEKDDD